MFPNADEIYYFIEVAKTKNISRAAERLGIRQPSLSAAIKRLEKHVGADIIIREKTGVQVSRAGMRLLESAEKMLEHWEEIKYAAVREKEESTGHFTIGCHNSIASHMLPSTMASFSKNYPDIELTFRHAPSREITEAIISWKVDIGIVVNPVQHSDLVIIKLCDDVFSFWHNPNIIQSPELLILDPILNQTRWLTKSAEKEGIYTRFYQTTNHELIARMTRDGVGVGLLPSRVAKIHGNNEICWVDKEQPFYSDEICLVYRREILRSQGAKRILETFKQADYTQG